MTRTRRTTVAGSFAALFASAAVLATSAPAFAAAPEKPETISPATGITATDATLHGVLNPKASAKAGWYFAYSTQPTCTAEGASETAHEEEVEGTKLAESTEVTGLEPNKKYEFCLIATGEEGAATTAGNQVSLTTLASPPEVAAESAHAFEATDDSATLEAQVNPNNQSTTYTFEYATKASGETLEGTVVKVKGAAPLTGYGNQPASVATGALLKPGTTYFFRVTAENAQSIKEKLVVKSAVGSFATLPAPFTDAATNVTQMGATFNGHLTLGPVASSYYFAYNTGAECTGGQATPTLEVRSTTPEAALSWEVPHAAQPELGVPATPPLTPDEEYTVCLVLTSEYGSQTGPAQHFNTPPQAPAISSEAAFGQGVLGVSLQAEINPNLQETTWFFEYATSQAALEGGEGKKLAGAPPAAALPAELKELPVSVLNIVPQPGVTYYYRAVAENQSTATEGVPADGEIHQYGLPELTAEPAENITRATATVAGSVNPDGAATTYRVVYVSQAGYEQALAGDENEKANPYAQGETTEPVALAAETTPVTVPPTQLTGLIPGGTYHYALTATSAIGTETTPDQTFTALPAAPPVAVTEAAGVLSPTSATLNGTVTTNGLPTSYAFEIGTEPGVYGPPTGKGTVAGETQAVAATINGLAPGTTYYYRLTATSTDGTVSGAPQGFTTPGLPYLLAPPAGLAAVPIPATALGHEPHTPINTGPPKLTNKQKLTKALKACLKDKKKSKRTKCERTAKKRFPVKKT